MSRLNFTVFLSAMVLCSSLVHASVDATEVDGNSDTEIQFVDTNAADTQIIQAVRNRRKVHFVEGGSMVVTRLLPDDNSGLRHQKWMVQLSSGESLQAVYNSDMCPHVPLEEGDVISMGGMFLWTNEGAMIHWLHHDPKGQRPDGYVKVNGKFYCKD